MAAKIKDTSSLKDLRVLLVDDQTEFLMMFKQMLTSMGLNQIFLAKSGPEAFQFLDSCAEMIDVVLCDWRMPQMSGLEILTQLRTVDPDFPFIMVSGVADQASILEAKAARVTSYLLKPFSQDELTKKLLSVQRMLKVRKQATIG